MKAPVQRFLSALCALSFLLAALFPTAALAAGADDLAVSNTLTREDAAQMQEADSAVAALTDSGDFAALSRAERFAAAQAQLQQLAEQGLVSVRSIYIDEANGMVSFSYSCGVQGGILVDDPEEENAAGTLPTKAEGNICFEHVDFSYDKSAPLIQDLNIDVKKGQNVAIVGPTGAGKTTIVNLLMRFYDVDRGRILIDGVDCATLSREEMRDQFAMVLQDTWLFRGTIAENVAYGKPDATREEIVSACDRAYCDHFIRTLPAGYDTVVGDDMTNLSGGQKQLLTIARAMLADRRLLILDEATSNVDTRTEALLQKAMDRLMRDRTCFVIAHRLSTIVDSDLILVLDHGQIVEQGTHAELLAKEGFYYQIYNSQYAI